MNKRPTWNEYFMMIAKVVSSRSTCLSRKVGAVIVKDNNILATGYNGASSGSEHCIDNNVCYRRKLNVLDKDKHNFCIASHAEVNAIAQAAKNGVSIKNSILYSTLEPCNNCLKLIKNTKIKKVFYEFYYDFNEKIVNKNNLIELIPLTVSLSTVENVQKYLHSHTSKRQLKQTL